MADYIPVFKPGQDLTMTAGAAITGGELVALSAANTVVKTAGASAAWLGVAMQDAASGAKVGTRVLRAVEASFAAAGCNTNLGISSCWMLRKALCTYGSLIPCGGTIPVNTAVLGLSPAQPPMFPVACASRPWLLAAHGAPV